MIEACSKHVKSEPMIAAVMACAEAHDLKLSDKHNRACRRWRSCCQSWYCPCQSVANFWEVRSCKYYVFWMCQRPTLWNGLSWHPVQMFSEPNFTAKLLTARKATNVDVSVAAKKMHLCAGLRLTLHHHNHEFRTSCYDCRTFSKVTFSGRSSSRRGS